MSIKNWLYKILNWIKRIHFTKKGLAIFLDTAYDLLLYSLIALCFMSAGYFVVCQAIDGIQSNYLYHISGLTAIGIVLSFVLVYFKSRSQ